LPNSVNPNITYLFIWLSENNNKTSLILQRNNTHYHQLFVIKDCFLTLKLITIIKRKGSNVGSKNEKDNLFKRII
jgi:hypothetical protein